MCELIPSMMRREANRLIEFTGHLQISASPPQAHFLSLKSSDVWTVAGLKELEIVDDH